MQKRTIPKTAILFLLLGLVIVLFLLLPQSPPPSGTTPETKSQGNLGTIAEALSHYQFANEGKLPASLADLVPDYISPEKGMVFFPPWSPATEKLSSENLQKNGAYVYWGGVGMPIGVVMHERFDLWSNHGDWNDGKLAVVLTNLSVKRVSSEELKQKLTTLSK